MAMFPIFMTGLIVGITISYLWYMFKKDSPSETKIRLLEKEIEIQKSDNKLINDLNDKLYNKISELEAELKNAKK